MNDLLFDDNSVVVLVREWAERINAQSVLSIASSNFGVFGYVEIPNTVGVSESREVESGRDFDLILGDFPLGMNAIASHLGGVKIKAQRNWIEIAESLSLLNNSGNALFLIEPLAFSSAKGKVFEEALNQLGYFVNCIFNCPEKLLRPHLAVTPVIVAVSKMASERLYVAELLGEQQVKQIVENYFSAHDSGEVKFGTYIDNTEFGGFNQIKVRQQIGRLETQYKTFDEHRLGDLATEINSVKSGESYQERDNAIYIPNIGNSPVVGNLADTKIKHHNYFQVVFEDSTISEYLVSFFKSALGQMILRSSVSQTFIPHLNKRTLEDLVIALPSRVEQESIVATLNKLQKLKDALQTFDEQLALNPTSSKIALEQLDGMLNVIGSLTGADRVHGLIREGESKTVEFKETLSLNARNPTGSKDTGRELDVLKTIVAFLNTEGGTLLIGVHDNGSIPGVLSEITRFHQGRSNGDHSLPKCVDRFLLHLKNLIKEQIGENYYPFIDVTMVDVDSRLVVKVECKPSRQPCYLKGEMFYVRTNPATDELRGEKMMAYLQNRFSLQN